MSRTFSLISSSVILFSAIIQPVSPKDEYVEPLLFGLKASLPYDMANLFNRFPFQGGLSLFLGLCLAGILFFGVITAPFGYMFGVPSEKYVLGDFALKHPEADDSNGNRRISVEPPSFLTASPRSSSSFLLDYVQSAKASPRTIFSDKSEQESEYCCQTLLHLFDAFVGYMDYWEPGFLHRWKPALTVLRNRLGGNVGKKILTTVESSISTGYTPSFTSSMFYLIPDSETDIQRHACQQRMICHAHGTLQYVPELLLKIYHKFSKKLAEIPDGFAEAIKIGMKNETLCSEFYSECEENAFTLTVKSYLSVLTDKQGINRMPRRKQKMYSHMNFLK